MKGIYFIHAICISLIINESLSKSVRYYSPNFECERVTIDNSDQYITNEMRYSLCKESVKNYDEGDKLLNLKECLNPNCNYNARKNPCAVDCHIEIEKFTPDMIGKLEFENLSNDPEVWSRCARDNECEPLRGTGYKRIERRFFNTSQRCGEKHFCDTNGCCVEREITTPTTTRTTTMEPKTETHSTTTPIPTTITTSKPSTTTPRTPETITHEPFEKPNFCEKVGNFKYPNDKTKRKYVSCKLKAIPMNCPSEQIFDEKLSHCVDIRQTIPSTTSTTTQTPTTESVTTTVTEPNWSKLIPCREEGFFRNPYNCSKFYRCYKNEETETTLRFANFSCLSHMLFDETEKDPTCIREQQYFLKFGECKVKPLPSYTTTTIASVITSTEHPYEKYLECPHEGYFRDPYNCHNFYQCYYNRDENDKTKFSKTSLRRCPLNLVFNELLATCANPENSDQCNNKVIPKF